MKPFMRTMFSLAVCGLALQAATLQGVVRDAAQHPVAGAIVQLQSRSVKTGSDGKFRFEALAAGSYTLVAEGNRFGPYVLAKDEVKQIEFALKPAFFDEPRFVVAGVTAGTYQGGHGSDTVLRSSENLAQATAALDTVSAAEESGDALQAVRDYARAAQLDPSERNLFDWGAELLKHRAAQPAIEVFTEGRSAFPASSRLAIGLAVAYYSLGAYERAAQFFFAACDIRPEDAAPYLFLGKVRTSAITALPGFRERMARFANLQPANAQALYFYAAALWDDSRGADSDRQLAMTLLQRAIKLDPQLADAYLLLGTMRFGAANSAEGTAAAIAAFQTAVQLAPEREEAHYRLAQAYRRAGDAAKAQEEIAIYDRLSKQSADQAQRARRELQQFVITLRNQ